MTKRVFTLSIFTSFSVVIWLFIPNQVSNQLWEAEQLKIMVAQAEEPPVEEFLEDTDASGVPSGVNSGGDGDIGGTAWVPREPPVGELSSPSSLAPLEPSVEEQPLPLKEAERAVEGLDASGAPPPISAMGENSTATNAPTDLIVETIDNTLPIPAAPSNTPPVESSDLALATKKYNIWRLEHNKALLQWQFAQSNALFFIVFCVVVIGLWFSYIQFKKGDKLEGNLKLGAAGIEITSSVLGVLILGFSVGFLYLYLIHAYPIQGIGQERPSSETTSSNSDSK